MARKPTRPARSGPQIRPILILQRALGSADR